MPDISVISPDGTPGTVPLSQLKAAIERGYRLPSDQEEAAEKVQDQWDRQSTVEKGLAYAGMAGPVGAVVKNAVSAFSDKPIVEPPWYRSYKEGVKEMAPLGLGNLANALETDPTKIQERKDVVAAEPTANVLGQVGGGIGFALGGNEVNPLFALASKATQSSGTLAKLGGRAVASVADNTLWGASKNLSDAVSSGDDEHLAEKVMATVGNDALWGLGGWAAGETIGAAGGLLLRNSGDRATSSLMKAAKGTPSKTAEVLSREASGEFGAGKNAYMATIDNMMENSYRPNGETYKANPKTTPQLEKWAQEQKTHWGQKLESLFKEPEVKNLPPEDINKFADVVRNEMYPEFVRKLDPNAPIQLMEERALTRVGPNGQAQVTHITVPAGSTNRGQVVREFVGNVDFPEHPAVQAVEKKIGELIERGNKKPWDLEGLWNYRKNLDATIFPDTVSRSEAYRATKDFRTALEQHIVQSAMTASNDIGGQYEQAKRFYAAANLLHEMAEHGNAAAAANHEGAIANMVSVGKKAIGKMALGALGFGLGGPAGLLGSLVAGGVMSRYGDMAAFQLWRNMARAQGLSLVSKSVDNLISTKVRQFLVSGAVNASKTLHGKDLGKTYDERSKAVINASVSPGAVAQNVGDATAGLAQHSPGVTNHIATKSFNSLSGLRQKLDALHQQNAPKTRSLTPMADGPVPMSDADKVAFLEADRIARNPLAYLDDLRSGTVHPAATESLTTFFPKTAQQIADEIVTQASQMKKPLTPAQEQLIYQLRGVPTHDTQMPDYAQWSQQNAFGPAPGQQGTLKKISNPKGTLGNMSQTDGDRIQKGDR